MTRDSVADAAVILHAAIAAADPTGPVHAALHAAPELAGNAAVHAIAVGKAACRMMHAAESLLHDRVATRLVIVPHGTDCAAAHRASHPIPDQSSVNAARAVVAALAQVPRNEPILLLLSGGASALIAHPADGISIADYAECVRLLNRAGASIAELNTVRKHIDQLKGGRLATLAAPRRVLGLVLSDVVGDRVDVIASGPLSPDPTTFADAIAILQQCGVWQRCAESIRTTLRRGANDLTLETPKRTADMAHARTVVIAGNATARNSAAEVARRLGYRVVEADTSLTGEARTGGVSLAEQARALQDTLAADDAPVCFITGGETTVTVRGTGRGGRNQELVLAAALALENTTGITVGSIGTDGIDGDSDAAGAIAAADSIATARSKGTRPEAYLDDNDSFAYFTSNGGLIVTGPTGTNVMDVQVLLVEPRVR